MSFAINIANMIFKNKKQMYPPHPCINMGKKPRSQNKIQLKNVEIVFISSNHLRQIDK